MAIASIDPSTGKTLKTFPPHSAAEVEARLAKAHAAFLRHRTTPLSSRAQRLQRAAALLEEEKDAFARMMAQEMGKPLTGGLGEVEKCARTLRYYAEHGARFLADEPIPTGEDTAFLRYQPLGVVLAVMPWNFPFWQVIRFAAPALMAGNVGLLKHASNVPQCALALEDLFLRAGFEEGVFQALLIGAERVAGVLEDARVAAATLTGSNAAGSEVAQVAGRCLKKTVLELGGSDPFVVLESADLDRAVEAAVKARIINNGQSCIAAKRFIVADAVYERFERAFKQAMGALRVGDPLDPRTDVGPLATQKILEELQDQVHRSTAKGARLVMGGRRRAGVGNYFEPTVLSEVPLDAAAATEEVFGPVAALMRARDLGDALRLANATIYGLGASAWTRDEQEQAALIDGIEAGCVFINQMVASDPRLPFGGVKQSGYGRELGALGMREFLNIKTVRVAP